MTQAGKYRDAFTWYKQTTTTDVYGQRIEKFTNNGTLWGTLTPSTGREDTQYGGLQAQSDGTVSFRQYPTLSAKDRLLHKRFNESYIINGSPRRGNNETIADVTRFETTIVTVGHNAFSDGFSDGFN